MTTTPAVKKATEALTLLDRRLRSLGIAVPLRRKAVANMSLVEAMAAFDQSIAAFDAWLDALTSVRAAITEGVDAMRVVMRDAMTAAQKT